MILCILSRYWVIPASRSKVAFRGGSAEEITGAHSGAMRVPPCPFQNDPPCTIPPFCGLGHNTVTLFSYLRWDILVDWDIWTPTRHWGCESLKLCTVSFPFWLFRIQTIWCNRSNKMVKIKYSLYGLNGRIKMRVKRLRTCRWARRYYLIWRKKKKEIKKHERR